MRWAWSYPDWGGGDPRSGVCDEALALCRIPAGPMMLGGDGLSGTMPYRFDIPCDFWASRYPVTNAQFARFLAANPPVDDGNIWSRRAPDPAEAEWMKGLPGRDMVAGWNP